VVVPTSSPHFEPGCELEVSSPGSASSMLLSCEVKVLALDKMLKD
jgi:hypothetical protein